MPTVKRYEPGQIKQAPTPFVPQQPNNIPSTAGKAVAQAGRDMMIAGSNAARQLIYQEKDLQDRKDKAAAKDAYVATGDKIRDLRTGLLGLKKKDAIGTTAQAQKKVDEYIETGAGELENDQQRELYRSLVLTRRASFLDGQAIYEAGEMEAWEKESGNAMADEAVQYAVENYSIPGVISDAEDKIDVAVTTGMKGSSAEAVKVVKESKISKLHQAVINNMAVNNAAEAKKYYVDNKEKIDGTVRTGIEEMLKTVGVKQESQQRADDIILSGVDYDGQLDAARAIKDPDVRDATVQRVKVREQERKVAETATREAEMDQLTTSIINIKENGGTYEEALDAAQEAVNGTDQYKLRGVAKSLFMKEDGITYPDKFIEAMARIDDRNHKKGPINSPAQLLRDYKPFLSNADFNQLTKYWQDGGSIGGLKDSRVKTIYKTLTGKNPDESSVKAKQYKYAWDHVVSNLPEGKKPTDEEIKRLLTQAVVDGERQGGGVGYGEDMGYLEAKRQGYSNTWLPDFTSDEKVMISNKLKAAGDPVTDTTIKMYKRVYILGLPMTKELKEILSKE